MEKNYNVVYRKRSDNEKNIIYTIKVKAKNDSWALQYVEEMDSDYIPISICSNSFIGLYKRYIKCYNKIEQKGKGNKYVFGDVDRYLNDAGAPNPYCNILDSYIVCDDLTPSGIYVADAELSFNLFDLSDYCFRQLVEWLENIVNVWLKGVKLDKDGE